MEFLFQHLVKARLVPDSSLFCKLANIAGSNWEPLLTLFENMQIHNKVPDNNCYFHLVTVLVTNKRLQETMKVKDQLESVRYFFVVGELM